MSSSREYNFSGNIIEIIIHLTSGDESKHTKVKREREQKNTQTRRIDEEKQIDLGDFNAKHERLLSIQHSFDT